MRTKLFFLLVLAFSIADAALGEVFFTSYTVYPGDSISKIASQMFGQGKMLKVTAQIVEANPWIKDPNVIHPGEEILIPFVVDSGRVVETFALPETTEVVQNTTPDEVESKAEFIPAVFISSTLPALRVASPPIEEIPPEANTKIKEQEVALAVKEPVSEKPVPVSKKRAYQVVLHVPYGTLDGVREGKFPALFLEGKDRVGWWSRSKKTSVTITEVTDGEKKINDITIVLSKKPAKDSAVAIDFEDSGNGFLVKSEHLEKGTYTEVENLPEKFGNKAYHALKLGFPKKPFSLVRFIRPVREIGPHHEAEVRNIEIEALKRQVADLQKQVVNLLQQNNLPQNQL